MNVVLVLLEYYKHILTYLNKCLVCDDDFGNLL